MSRGTRLDRDIRLELRRMAPSIPLADAQSVWDGAARMTRSGLPVKIAVWLALTARVRHAHTDYDRLLDEGYDQDAARFFVVDAMEERLRDWGCNRRIGDEPLEAE